MSAQVEHFSSGERPSADASTEAGADDGAGAHDDRVHDGPVYDEAVYDEAVHDGPVYDEAVHDEMFDDRAFDGSVGEDRASVSVGPVCAADPVPAAPVDPAISAATSARVLRADFGAHLETHYARLVAQLYAITLDAAEAHDVVQDAYSRAWREWAVVGATPDPTAWVRRVAVRSTIRSWRRAIARVGVRRPRPVGDGVDPRTGALLGALGRLPAAERRCVVLVHMAGASVEEVAALEQVPRGAVQARLARARSVVTEGMADVLQAVLGVVPDAGDPYVDEEEYR